MPNNQILLSADWILPVTASPVKNGVIIIEDGKIKNITKIANVPLYLHKNISYFKNSVIMPGTVNIHSHLDYSFIQHQNACFSFFDWLDKLILQTKDWDLPTFHKSALYGVEKCVENGITCIADTSRTGLSLAACQRYNLKGIIYQEVFGYKVNTNDVLSTLEHNIHNLEKRLKNDRFKHLKAGISPHAPYTVSPDVFGSIISYASKYDYPLHTHLAESEDEYDWFMHKKGYLYENFQSFWNSSPYSPVKGYLEKKLLQKGMITAHCIQVDEDDVNILKNAEVIVAVCPRSNYLLNRKIFPLDIGIKAGVKWAIGTDSMASTQSLNLFDEIKALIKFKEDKIVNFDLGYKDLIDVITIKAAEYINMDRFIGSIDKNKQADLIVLDNIDSETEDDLYHQIIFKSKPVLTLINGQAVYNRDNAAS